MLDTKQYTIKINKKYDLMQTKSSNIDQTLLLTIIKKMITFNGNGKEYQEVDYFLVQRLNS